VWSTTTLYGGLDVLVGRARRQGSSLFQRASIVRVADVDVTVASTEDAWALRRRFKGNASEVG
jgi:hypothetical protein